MFLHELLVHIRNKVMIERVFKVTIVTASRLILKGDNILQGRDLKVFVLSYQSITRKAVQHSIAHILRLIRISLHTNVSIFPCFRLHKTHQHGSDPCRLTNRTHDNFRKQLCALLHKQCIRQYFHTFFLVVYMRDCQIIKGKIHNYPTLLVAERTSHLPYVGGIYACPIHWNIIYLIPNHKAFLRKQSHRKK